MAVADHNVRPRTTIHEELHEVLKADAQRHGLAVSEMIAWLIESHYVAANQYTPQNAQWKTKLAIHLAGQQSLLASSLSLPD